MSDYTWTHDEDGGDSHLALTATDGDVQVHVAELGGGWATTTVPATELLAAALEAAGITPETLDQQVCDDIGVGHYGSAVEAMCALLWPDDGSSQ